MSVLFFVVWRVGTIACIEQKDDADDAADNQSADDPHCFRKVFGYICICLECCIFKKYNERWIVLKDDMITYSDLSASSQGKHVYFFDKEIKAVRNGKLSITITNLSRVLELKFKTYSICPSIKSFFAIFISCIIRRI